jgi:formate dehydrogenase iron-sulfur subunit
MTPDPITVRISDDALALACGADVVARAFVAAGCNVERVSSWGMHWLEPLVEIEGIGWGPVTSADVAEILKGSSGKCIGPIAKHPFIARQQRLTFARAGNTRPRTLTLSPTDRYRAYPIRPSRTRRGGVSCGDQVADGG